MTEEKENDIPEEESGQKSRETETEPTAKEVPLEIDEKEELKKSLE